MGDAPALTYRLCPRCSRALPSSSTERYCVNDGAALIDACGACGAAITSPLARYCPQCGKAFADSEAAPGSARRRVRQAP